MEDASEHCAEVSGGVISKIVGDGGHGQPHRQLLEAEHKAVLASPDGERHPRIAEKQACESTFAGTGFLGPALKRAIVVGRLPQSLHDTKDPTILAVGNNQRRLPHNRDAVEKKADEAHFGGVWIDIPWHVDRDVQKLSAETVEVKSDAFGRERGRNCRRRKQAAKSDGPRISHPMLDAGRNPNGAIWRGDPDPLPCADCRDAADDRDQLTSVVSMGVNASWSVLIPRHPGNGAIGGVRVGIDREEVGTGVNVHFVSSNVFVLALSSWLSRPPRASSEQEVDQRA